LLLKLGGLTEPAVLTMLGFANILAAIYVFRRLPKQPDRDPASV